MAVDISIYRARVGSYYSKAFLTSKKLSFVNASNVLQFIALLCLHSPCNIQLSLFFNFLRYCCIDNFSCVNCNFLSNCRCTNCERPDKAGSNIFIKRLILMLSGDIERNPGPTSNSDLKIIHINIDSIRNKMDIFEAEYNQMDIIAVSETWLSPSVSNNSIAMSNFHPPVRRDRPNDAHGGVAIYVRNSLVCKPRPDLHVVDLEAVWVESKLDQTSFLIGCFYRPPSSNVNYWDLIKDSIRKVNNTSLKFIILGDFNTDFLKNPSPYFIEIINQYMLAQLIHEPTRTTENSETCLDLILT